MRSDRRRFDGPAPDAGMTIIEVVVALVVLAIMSTGIAAGTATINRITSDSRYREIATNLAAQDLDSARALGDPFKILPQTSTQSVSGRLYTTVRDTSWVSSGGADVGCGTSTNYTYRRVTARVTWAGQLTTTQPVVSSTVIAPTSHITDAGTGAISIKVIGSDGTARAGVAVAVVSKVGGQTPTAQPAATDSQGCAYATQLLPGTYTVTLSKDGYIDTNQDTSPAQDITVAAGSTAPWTPQYDQWATFTTSYAGNFTDPSLLLPTKLDTSFVPNTSSFPIYTTSQRASTVNLHPAGYTAVAGTPYSDDRSTTVCSSADPNNWPAGKVSGVQMAVGTRAAGSAAAGLSAAFTAGAVASIPMGVVKITAQPGIPLAGQVITAQSTSNAYGDGNPGCETSTSYVFPALAAGTSAYLALPFGSWTLLAKPSSGSAFYIPKNYLSAPTNKDANGAADSSGTGVIVLDPRARS